MQNGEQDTAYGTIALESEAFLLGNLVEYRDDKGIKVPVWAWMNRLAHGSALQIGECVIRSDKPRRIGRSWRVARSYLAFEVLDLTDLQFTLAELQSSVLIPLELEMAARPDVAGWHRGSGWTWSRTRCATTSGRWISRAVAPSYEERRSTQRSTVRASAGNGRIPARSTRSWNSLRSKRAPSRRAASARSRTISRRPTM